MTLVIKQDKPTHQLLADFALLAITIIWGSTFTVVDKAIETIDVLIFIAIRFSVAFIVLLLIFSYRFFISIIRWGDIWRGVVIGIFLFAGYAFQTFGLNIGTEPGKAAFITGLSVILVPIFAVLILKKAPNRLSWIGIFVAIIGLGLLSIESVDFQFADILGDILVLICAFGFAFQIIFTDRYVEKVHYGILVLTQIGTTAVLSWIASAIFLDENFSLSRSYFTNQVLFAIFFTGIIATSLVLAVQTYAQKKTSPIHIAIIYAMEPVFGAIFSIILTGEKLLPRQWGGCVLILICMIYQQLIDIYSSRKRNEKAKIEIEKTEINETIEDK